jgi:hypothetical protein
MSSHSSFFTTNVLLEQQMRQMAQDIEVARNNAHMLIEAVSFADPEMEAIEENELIKVRAWMRYTIAALFARTCVLEEMLILVTC